MARGRGRPGRTNNQSFENSNMQQSSRTFLKRKIETDEDDKNVFLTPLPLKRQSLGSNAADCNSEVCKSEVCMNSSDKACSPRKGEFKRCLFGVENGDNWKTRHLRSMGKVTNCLELPNAGRGNAVARKDKHANGSGSNKCGKLRLLDSPPHTCIQMHMVETEVDLSKDELSNAERGNAVAGKDSQANCSGNNKCDKPCSADSPPHTCIQMHMDESEVDMSKDELPKPDEITVPFAENDATLCIPCSTDKCSSSDCAYPFTPQLGLMPLVAEQNGVHSSRSFAENVDNDITTTEVFVKGCTDAENPSLSDSGPTTMSSCKSDMTVVEAGNIPSRLEELQYEVEKYSESINVGSVNLSDDHSRASPEKIMSEGCEKGSQEREAVRLTEQEDIIERTESGCKQICPSNGFQPSEMDSSAEVGQVFALQNFTTAENCQDEKEENKESEGDNTEKAILEPIENCERSEDNESKCNPGSPDLHHTEKAILEPMEHCERSEDNGSKCNPGSPDFHHTEKAILEPMEHCERSEDNESKCNPGSPDFHHTEKAILEPMEQCERSEDSESKCNPGTPDFHQSQSKVQSRPLNADTLSPSTRMLRSQTSKLGASPTNIATQLESMQRDVSVSKNQPLWNSTKVKLKIKMPEKIVLDQVPSTVKLLLLTGLLEGRFVKYVGRGDQVMLTGVIRGPGILCGCNLCKGKTVVSICNFEEHAGSTARHASDFIILENGRSLRDILEECKGVSVDNFPDVIRKAIDSSNRGFHACRKCRAPIDQSNQGKSSSLCQTCDLPPQIQPKVEHTPIVRKRGRPRILDRKVEEKPLGRPRILDRKVEEKPLGRPRILDRKVEEKPLGRPRILDWKVEEKPLGRPRILDQKVEEKPQTKTLTKSSPKVLDVKVREKPAVQFRVLQKDMTLHKIIFKPRGLPDGTKLAYYVKGQRLLDGHKQGFGIFCSCCKTVLSSSQFEAHAGRASRRNPYNSIYLSDGRSLHEVALELADQQGLNDDNEDYCGECGDGGDLVCCDGCPRVFHKECVGLPHVPKGKYYCSFCRHQSGRGRKLSSRKELKTPGKSVGAGPLEKPSNRCTRVVKAPEKTVGGCVLCRREDFEKVGFGDRTVMLCDQCEKEFHVGCLREHNMADLKKLPEDEWFCSNDCKKIHCALQKLVEHGPKTIPKELIKNHTDNGVDEQSNAMINWQLLYGKTRDPDKRALLSKAVAIFAECFDPIIDPVTGRDLIPSMVYSRSIRDQEFGGMYCAVLTVDSMVVSAGVFRVFGGQVAELPLVATSPKCQGQGYFQALFSSIERLLGCLNIENLVLPAAEEAESLWINKFGFTNMSEEQFYTYRKDLQIMSFQGNSMLEKPLISLSSIHARSNKGV